MKRYSFILIVCLVIFAISGFFAMRVHYASDMQFVKEYCRAESILNIDTLKIDPNNIDCKVIHHDILITLKISEKSDFLMDCNHEVVFFNPIKLTGCSIYLPN